jgi:transglutaminase/protease-like cytokinesis protein 3
MKKFLLVIFASIYTSLSMAQISQELIDKVTTYPSSFKMYEQLSERIINDFEGDYDRAAAIYTWMASNIRYDAKAFFSGRVQRIAHFSYRNEAEKYQKEQELRDELASKTLKTKKAVCQGYAELFRLLCQACAIQCEVISGFSRTGLNDIGKARSAPDHAWNAIRINDKWILADATWGAGYVDYKSRKFVPNFTSAYFDVKPTVFAYSHFPEDEQWNFTALTLNDFWEQPLFFPSFFSLGMELVSPSKGVIAKAKRGMIIIELKVSGGKEHAFNYAFRDMKYMKDAKVKKDGKLLTLSIETGNRRSAYLDIIIDGETVMTYKLKL